MVAAMYWVVYVQLSHNPANTQSEGTNVDTEIATWFNSWDRVQSILLSGLAVYIGVIILVRISGKRTTSQMNNFDWIITVALGGLISSGILLKEVSVVDAMVAASWLVFLQWIMTWLVIRSEGLRHLVKAQPALLVTDGAFIQSNMTSERVSADEVMAALRENGLHELKQAKWVILETDASFSVVADNSERPDNPQILNNVGGRPQQTG